MDGNIRAKISENSLIFVYRLIDAIFAKSCLKSEYFWIHGLPFYQKQYIIPTYHVLKGVAPAVPIFTQVILLPDASQS